MSGIAEQMYTTPQTVIARVQEHLKEHKMNIKELSLKVDKSRSAISQVLNGTYTSDPTAIEMALEEYLNEFEEENSVDINEVNRSFFLTEDAQKIVAICEACQGNQGFGALVGRSGFGKTHTLKEFAKLPKVARIECDDSMGARDLIEAIEDALGIPSTYGTISRLTKRIKKFFEVNQGYLLIIDEADKLISKYTQKKIEIIRAIFDQAPVGIVIAGEPALEVLLRTYDARLANRIDFFVTLKGLRRTEITEYMRGYNIDPQALEELIVRATNSQTGCFRLFNRTLNNVFRLIDEEDRITVSVIEEASGMMLL